MWRRLKVKWDEEGIGSDMQPNANQQEEDDGNDDETKKPPKAVKKAAKGKNKAKAPKGRDTTK